MIFYDDFLKIELCIGTVLTAEKILDSAKLIKLLVSIGTETRQIIAGIGKTYEPESLVGRQVAIVKNLEPRTLMGLESSGMVLAASDGSPVLLVPDRPVLPGTKIQ